MDIKERSKSLQYYYDHKEERLKYEKLYKRQHVIRQGGTGRKDIYGVNKAPYPENKCCSSCHHPHRLMWHHWDERNPDDGLWVCHYCHMAIEIVQKSPELIRALNSFLQLHPKK